MVADPEVKCQVHQEDGQVFHFQFDNQAFEALLEVVEARVCDDVAGQKSVALLV